MSSILNDTKHTLGVSADNTAFDSDIIMYINSAFADLAQIGVGPVDGFSIVGVGSNWSDVIGSNKLFNSVQTYIYLKTKLLFDPPTTGYLVEAVKEQIREREWRLSQVREFTDWTPPVVNTNNEEMTNGLYPITFSVPGVVTVFSDGPTIPWGGNKVDLMRFGGKLIVPPQGSSLIARLMINNLIAAYLEFMPGVDEASTTSFTIPSLVNGDDLKIVVPQIGSSIPGEDLGLALWVQ